MSKSNYTIKILENSFGKSGTGFSRKPIFEFTGELTKFNMASFEKRLKSIMNKRFVTWAVAAFLYSFTMRLALSL